MAQTIKRSGRTFALIDLAKLIVAGRDRYEVTFKQNPKAKELEEGKGPPKIVRCTPDGSLWLSREEALRHFLGSESVADFYGTEDVAVDPPKGNFTGVAVCGMSGVLLGPPNHHTYQDNLLRLHRERFANLPLDRFKSKIRVESGEEIVGRWKEEHSRRTEWIFPKPAVPEPAGKAGEEKEGASPSSADASGEGEAEPGPPSEAAAAVASPGEGVEGVEGVEAAPENAAAENEPAPADEATAAEPGATGKGEEVAEAQQEPETDRETDVEALAVGEGESDGEGESEAAGEGPEEPAVTRITSRPELERHIREHLADEVIKEVTVATVPGNIPGRQLSAGLLEMVRRAGENVRHHPPMLIAGLCDMLGAEGLKFFRWGGKQLFTAATRPRQLDAGAALSESVRAIFDFVRETPGAKPQDLIEKLAPHEAPVPPPAAPGEPVEKAEDAPPESGSDKKEAGSAGGSGGAGEPPTKPPTKPAEEPAPELTEKEVSVLKDLRWLVGEGFIVEFGDGRLETVFVREQTPGRKSAKTPQTKGSPAEKGKAPDTKGVAKETGPEASAPGGGAVQEGGAVSGGEDGKSGTGPQAPTGAPGAPPPAEGGA